MLIEEEIQRVILDGEYPPGHRINEKELSLRFGISRGPVREALRALESSGLIEQVPNRGVFVRHLTAQQAADLYDVRAVLFALAGSLLAARATDAEISELRDLVTAMDHAIAENDRDSYVKQNFALHESIVNNAGNPALAEQYLSLVTQLRLYRTRNLTSPESIQLSNKEHHEMVEAIAAHDVDRAHKSHRDHVTAAKQRLLHGPTLT
jgi:DNA-binding GntR family transcriptional regulator